MVGGAVSGRETAGVVLQMSMWPSATMERVQPSVFGNRARLQGGILCEWDGTDFRGDCMWALGSSRSRASIRPISQAKAPCGVARLAASWSSRPEERCFSRT